MATDTTVRTRQIDWDDYVRRLRGPLPAKDVVYEFSRGIKKYEPRDYNPFSDETDS